MNYIKLIVCFSFASLALPAWPAIYKCADSSGQLAYSDKPCEVGQTQLDKSADPASSQPSACPPWTQRVYKGISIPAVIYKQPEEKLLLTCEIEHTKKNIDALKSQLQEYIDIGSRRQLGDTPSANAAIGERVGVTRAAISAEEARLAQLELQLKLGPGFIEHREKLREWSERCNHVALQQTSDRSVHEQCKVDERTLFGN